MGNPTIFWDTLKTVIRGKLTAQPAALKKMGATKTM